MRSKIRTAALVVVGLMPGLAQAAVQGTYRMDCIEYDEGLYFAGTVNYSEGVIADEQIFYSDAACQTALYSYAFKGTYRQPAAEALDITTGSLAVTYFDAAMIADLNSSAYCGLSWRQGESQDITGLSCDGAEFPAAGDTSYQAVREVDGGLIYAYPSAEQDGSSAEKRPTDFESAEGEVWKSVPGA